MKLELTVSAKPDARQQHITSEIDTSKAIRGFQNVTITQADIKGTADVLTELLDYELAEQQVNRYRFVNKNAPTASVIDLVEAPGERRGHVAGGSVHHVAFRVKDDATEMALRAKIEAKGFNITPQIDRNYFHSLYFREPGGVLFEIATDNPGFTVDEPLEHLGESLKLPAMYESRRAAIEAVLPVM